MVNYRQPPSGDFESSLHDSLSAYVYLTRILGVESENITLSGDSNGAGLSLSLQLYLSCLTHRVGDLGIGLSRPSKLLLHSQDVMLLSDLQLVKLVGILMF